MSILRIDRLLSLLALFVFFDRCAKATAFRLNVPRVLLPYHPSNQVQFQLEVTHPEGGCFTWRSSRTDIVSVEAVDGEKAKGCSDKAIITSRSRHTDQQSAVILAEEQGGGLMLSCDVTVDIIYSIAITTTTKVLFVDAAPVLLGVEAFNKEGDRFSALGNIPFDWFFDYNEGQPLHIIPFAQSKYNAPPGIEDLEKQKRKGNIVLVEGVSMGSAQLSAKFSESYFSLIPMSSIELFVLANVMLVPSNDLYLPMFSMIKYGAVLLRKGRSEPINLPSNQYQLKLDNSTVCDLDMLTSVVTATALGSSEITLVDKVMKPRVEFKPRSAHIFVVEPHSLQFSISRGNNWHLQLETEYEIIVTLVDQLGNIIFIPDNAVFSTKISETHFSILERTENGTYFRLIPQRAGKLTIRSSLEKMIAKSGDEINVSEVKGEQNLEILTPISVEPEIVLFPFHSKHRYEFQMKATGGSGLYHWSSLDASIAQIHEKSGMLRSGRLGETTIIVQDAYNSLNRASAKGIITEPFEMQFAPSPVEAEIGSTLTLRVKLLGQTPSGLVPFSDCRHIFFTSSIVDSSIFIVDEKAQTVVPEGGCTTLTLYAVREGDTKLQLKYNRFVASIDISAYPPLKIHVKSALLLTLGAGIGVTFEGGPRPWVLDNTKYTTNVIAKNVNAASALIDGNKSFKAFCRDQITDSDIILTVGNHKTVENPIPAVATARVKMCCSVPTNLMLSIPRLSNGELPVCPAFSHSTYFNAPFNLVLNAQGRCMSDKPSDARLFDSINSLEVDYETDARMLKIEKITDDSDMIKSDALAVGIPHGITGPVEIEAVVAHFYDLASATPTQKIVFHNAQFHASLTLNFVDFARANPYSIVLWNDKSVKGHVRISGGSGHFWLDATAANDHVTASLHGKDANTEVEILPKNSGVSTLTLFDLCIEGSRIDVEVKVTDISGIQLEASEFVKTGGMVGIKVAILDADKKPFSGVDINDIQVSLSPTGPFAPDGTANTVELVLRNLATRQVVRFPVNMKLVTEVTQRQFLQSPIDVTPASTSVSETHYGTSEIYLIFHGIREVLSAFFEGYQAFVLSTMILLATILVFAAAYRYGYLHPFFKGPSLTNKSGMYPSPVQSINPFGAHCARSPAFGERAIFNSTMKSSFNEPATYGVSPLLRNNSLSSLDDTMNKSHHSAGSDDDPYLWTSSEKNRMHNSSLINRHYN